MAAKAPAPAPAPADPYAGQGGSYEIDAQTGERRLVAQTQPPGSPAYQPDDVVQTSAPDASTPSIKE